MSRITLISSDGHVAARMSDYRPYLESEYLEDFEAFLVEYGKYGVVTTDSTNIANRLDPDVAAEWQRKGRGTGPARCQRGAPSGALPSSTVKGSRPRSCSRSSRPRS